MEISLQEKHANEKAALESTHRDALTERERQAKAREEDLGKRHQNEMAEQKRELSDRLVLEKEALQQRLVAEHGVERQQLQDRHADDVARMQREREQADHEAQVQIDKHKLTVAERESSIGKLQAMEKKLNEMVQSLQQKLSDKSAELLQQRQSYIEQMQEQAERLKAQHQAELDAIVQENLEETRALNSEFQRARDMMTERYGLLEQRYASVIQLLCCYSRPYCT